MNVDVTRGEIAFSRPLLGTAEADAVADVLRSGWIVGGAKVGAFEQLIARYCRRAFGIATSSWTTGAFLVLKAWGIGPGDEVIVPSLSFIASANVVSHTGATPVFADVDARSWNVTPGDIAARIGPKTKAIVAVDQLGNPCDLRSLASLASHHGVWLLDDAACALGSFIGEDPVGSFGDAAVFSFHARKVITTGEGGMIVTDDVALAEQLRQLRDQGSSASAHARRGLSPIRFETYAEVGYNARMTDIQGALGVVQFTRLEGILTQRRVLAERYTAALKNVQSVMLPLVKDGNRPNWQSYQVILIGAWAGRRNELLLKLHRHGIHAKRGVMAAHLEPCYAGRQGSLPVTEGLASSTLQLPLHPQLTTDEQDRVVGGLQEILAEQR